MSTEAIAEKIKIVPLYIHDATKQMEDGSYVGCFDLITKPTYTDDVKVIADVKPYGGNFPDHEEAKAYAKLFAASPDLLRELRLYVITCKCGNHSSGTINFNSTCYKCISAVSAIQKATL